MKKKFIVTATAASIITGIAVDQEVLWPMTYAAEVTTNQATTIDKATWMENLKRYLSDDHQYIKSYQGYHFAETELVLGEGESQEIELLDDVGNPVDNDVEWYVYTTVPYDNFFSESESREDLAPENYGGELYQKASLVKISEDGKRITARKMDGKQESLSGWLVAIYQGEYAHILPVKVIREEKVNEERLVDEKVAEILDQMKDLSDPDKVVFAFRYLVDHIDYDYKYVGRASQYNSLVKGKAVCEGYARAFKYLMDKSGIVCEYQVGHIKTSGAQGEVFGDLHAWNRVKIDGKWYYVDATWGDPLWGTDYRYLFASKEFMKESREIRDNNQDLGEEYLNYVTPEKDMLPNIGMSVEQQVQQARDSLNMGLNKVKIFIPTSENPDQKQYQVRDMFQKAGGYIEYQTHKALKTSEAGILYEYTLMNNVDFEDIKRSIDLTVSSELVDEANNIVQVNFDQDVDLQPYNIFLSDGKVAEGSLKKLSDREYTFKITDNQSPSVELQIQKSQYKVLSDAAHITLLPLDDVPMPTAEFIGESINEGYLTNMTDTMEYNLGDGIWRAADSNRVLVTPSATADYENKHICARIFVRNKINQHYSNLQEIKITRPIKAPEWIRVATTEEGNLVKFVSNTEYKSVNATQWLATTGNTVENLAKGTYEFRIKGRNNAFASASHQITIAENPTKKSVVTTKEVPFSTIYQADDSLVHGQTQIITPGQNGIETTTTTYSYNQATAAFDENVAVAITTPTINQVVAVGTKATVTTTTIPFTTERQANEEMYVGEEKVVVPGIDGVATTTTTYQLDTTTGEVSELASTRKETTAPVTQIIAYGTKEKEQPVDPDNGGNGGEPDNGNGGETVEPDNGGNGGEPDNGNGGETDNGNGGETVEPTPTPKPVRPITPVAPSQKLGWDVDYYYKVDGTKAVSEWIYDATYQNWFYLKADGKYARDEWVHGYYLRSNGAMARNEWIYDATYANWFFVGANGHYLHDTWVAGYWLNANGEVAHDEWIYDATYANWFFVGANGHYLHDTWLGAYYLKANGEVAHDEWIHDGKGWYFLKDDGQYARDEWINSYYLAHDGKLAE